MKKKVKYLILLLPLFLTGCMGGDGGGFDIQGFLGNPFIMAIIIIAVLYYVFKQRGQK